MKKVQKKIAGTSQHLRQTGHTPNWKEVEILAKENNIAKQNVKESVAVTQGMKDNFLNKKDETKFIIDIKSQ